MNNGESKKWDDLIEAKVADAKKRGSKKRGWIKLDESFIYSSINYRMAGDAREVFIKLLLFADKYGPVAGLISDNDFRPMPHEYLAHQACCTLELLKETIKKSTEDDAIYENERGIFLTHFDDYQFTAYDKQSPSRQAKRNEGRPSFKKCPECGYRGKTTDEKCPECGKTLEKDFTGGTYGHMVKQ